MSALNKHTYYSRDMNSSFHQYGLGMTSYYTDRLNRMHASTKDQRTIYQFDINSDLDVTLTKNITNEDEGEVYMIVLNSNHRAIFASQKPDPSDADKNLFTFKIYDYEEEQFIHNGSFSFENKYNAT
mmetsp:Transcript_33171/g.30095  ORF Transcript_33171/g.30095 Transcript_33171/m.30095 type:complete len:127 (-) Transcript_33171:1584-1964(-)